MGRTKVHKNGNRTYSQGGYVSLDKDIYPVVAEYMAMHEIDSFGVAVRSIIIEWASGNPLQGAIIAAAKRAQSEGRQLVIQRMAAMIRELNDEFSAIYKGTGDGELNG